MNTTRRGWLTAITSLIALPALSKSSASPQQSTASSDSLTDLLARQSYSPSSHSIPWDEEIRIPLTVEEIRCREEYRRDDIHFLRTRGATASVIRPHQDELRDLATARKLLEHLPTGRPLVFRYTGGRQPGQSRTVLPTFVFHTDTPRFPGRVILVDPMCPGSYLPSPLYLQAYCLERLAPRTFRLDRIHHLTPLATTTA